MKRAPLRTSGSSGGAPLSVRRRHRDPSITKVQNQKQNREEESNVTIFDMRPREPEIKFPKCWEHIPALFELCLADHFGRQDDDEE